MNERLQEKDMGKWEMGRSSKKREEGEIKVHIDKANEMRARKQGQARAVVETEKVFTKFI